MDVSEVVGAAEDDDDVVVGCTSSSVVGEPHAARSNAMAQTRETRWRRTIHVPTRPGGRFPRVARPDLTPACLWRISTPLVVALDERFGEPIDAYVNGSQVWFRDDGPGGVTIEWRLHPVAGFKRPAGVGTYELFGGVTLALATGGTPPAAPETLWDGLEAFPAYGDDVEPAVLAAHCADALGLPPDRAGLVDHESVADAWERSRGAISIVERLVAQLAAPPPSDTP